MTKFYDSFSNPTPILEKSENSNILKCAKPIFVDSNFFLVFSHNIELGNIVRIKERNIKGSVHIRENQQLENRHFQPVFGCLVS